MILSGLSVIGARVLIVGFTFKENVPDVRNTGVVHLVRALESYGVDVTIHDPHADPDEVRHEYGLELSPIDESAHYDAIVLAVAHAGLPERVMRMVAQRGVQVVIDVKAAIKRSALPTGTIYWRL
jgi:UDP-N-acetyl-D-galactosamine dehydrogenase